MLPIDENECVVRGLVMGKGYEFAVAAVNDAGTGEWSEVDEELTPQPPSS